MLPSAAFRFPDTVRIVRLRTPTREISGTPHVLRQPTIGETGTVVGEGPAGTYLVEHVDADGMTPWLAGFGADELELVERP